ncbi:SRPBCC domain-containing protein [Streptomyces sp.]|uniref:SRPBCC domain-containing protein n=1 Tax=Streptomyces sp. TaxID=1931 RepID=UPI002812315B|nr:SRPBCC domain-containing protein [Streptomyces sp.]
MEHEVFVPVPAEALRATLTDPARVARCVPGLQRDADADADPLSGRLKVRVGGHTITYRGSVRIVERDGALTYEGTGTEVRGTGTAEVSLTVVLTPLAGGTGLGFTGALEATGRLAEATEQARATAGARVLDRFVESLTALAGDARPEAEAGAGAVPEAAEDRPDTAGEPRTPADQGPEADSDDDGVDDGIEEPGRPSVFDTPVPPSGLDPLLDEDFPDVHDVPDVVDVPDTPAEFPAPQPAAEAAHARRTMIGRSAEEVDHAPPRGRYAPVPAPESSNAGATLRWIAPAAALALASAVVVGRALRRRR